MNLISITHQVLGKDKEIKAQETLEPATASGWLSLLRRVYRSPSRRPWMEWEYIDKADLSQEELNRLLRRHHGLWIDHKERLLLRSEIRRRALAGAWKHLVLTGKSLFYLAWLSRRPTESTLSDSASNSPGKKDEL